MSVLGSAGRLLNLRTQSGAVVPFDSANSLTIPLFGGRTNVEKNMAAYGSVGTLFSIVDLLSTNTASGEWTLYTKSTTGNKDDRTPVPRHAAIDMWQRPNAFYSESGLTEAVQQHVELTGEGWIVVGFSSVGPFSKVPLELWPVRPDRIRPVPDAEKFIGGYVYTGPNGEQIPLEIGEVLRIKLPNPLDPFRGLGPVQSILTDLDSTKYSAEWNRNFFKNSAQPGGIIELPEQLDDTEFDTMRRRWDEQHKGVNKAHRVAILEMGKWVPVGFSMKDLQFAELRQVSRDTIMEAFGVHKIMLGITEDVNRANADAGELVTARWKVKPRLNRWRELRNQSLKLWPGAWERYEWDYRNPEPADREADMAELTGRVAAAKSLIDMGVKPEVAFESVGLPDMEMAGGGASLDIQARMVQQLYLGVDTILLWEEARDMLVAAGVPIDPKLEKPKPPAPQLPPGADPAVPPAAPGGTTDAYGRPTGAENIPPYRAVDPTALVVARQQRRLLDRHGELRAALAPEDVPGLAAVQGDWEDALAALLVAWGPVTAAQRAELVRSVEQIIDSGQPALLTTLRVGGDTGADLLLSHLQPLADTAADRVVEEAGDQAVEIEPADVPASTLSTIAVVSAGLLAAGLALSAGREALRVYRPGATGREVSQAVNAHLRTLTDAAQREQLGAALTGAQNAARLATIAAAPPSAIYATEAMDKTTCQPCRKIDGTWLGQSNVESDLVAVEQVYPNGGYVNCDGRNRCRGTVVAVWE